MDYIRFFSRTRLFCLKAFFYFNEVLFYFLMQKLILGDEGSAQRQEDNKNSLQDVLKGLSAISFNYFIIRNSTLAHEDRLINPYFSGLTFILFYKVKNSTVNAKKL